MRRKVEKVVNWSVAISIAALILAVPLGIASTLLANPVRRWWEARNEKSLADLKKRRLVEYRQIKLYHDNPSDLYTYLLMQNVRLVVFYGSLLLLSVAAFSLGVWTNTTLTPLSRQQLSLSLPGQQLQLGSLMFVLPLVAAYLSALFSTTLFRRVSRTVWRARHFAQYQAELINQFGNGFLHKNAPSDTEPDSSVGESGAQTETGQ